MIVLNVFTFHNVSINTAVLGYNQKFNYVIYIPQCFY